MNIKTVRLLFVLCMLTVAVSCIRCTYDRKPRSNANPQLQELIRSECGNFRIDTLFTGLKNPWGMVWLPDGKILVTERTGQIRVFEDETYSGEDLTGLPEIHQQGQGGLMDIQLHPRYAENGWVYISFVKPGQAGGNTALMRFQLTGNHIHHTELLYQANPQSKSGVHFGSRIVFDKRGYLYLSTGERGTKENAQDLSNDMGKIHRLHDDGRIPADNPFANQQGAKPSIWSYGHRNVQGLAYDASNDILYATEHGPRGGDELNSIEKGKNYGWPVITYGIDYSGAIISELTGKEGMEQPIHYWTPSIGPCGLLYYTGIRYPGWKDNLFAGALARTHVARIEVRNERYVHEEKLLQGIGRVRHIAQSPSGFIFVLTEDPGMLLKLIPAN